MSSSRDAIVIGGSMAGLIAARALWDHYDRFILIERDALPDEIASRARVPQGRHVHGLLVSGFAQLRHCFPGIREALTADVAVVGDMAESLRWHQYGAYQT